MIENHTFEKTLWERSGSQRRVFCFFLTSYYGIVVMTGFFPYSNEVYALNSQSRSDTPPNTVGFDQRTESESKVSFNRRLWIEENLLNLMSFTVYYLLSGGKGTDLVYGKYPTIPWNKYSLLFPSTPVVFAL